MNLINLMQQISREEISAALADKEAGRPVRRPAYLPARESELRLKHLVGLTTNLGDILAATQTKTK